MVEKVKKRVCRLCGGKHWAKGLCKKHYSQAPETKARQRAYYRRNRKKILEWHRAYFQRPEVKERMRFQDKHNVVATARALVNARKFLSAKTAEAFVLDGVALEKRERELKKSFPPNEKAFLSEA